MERDCDTCKYTNYGKCREPCFSCCQGDKWEIFSNADRIRLMTDEELADFIDGISTTEYDMWGDYDPKTIVTQEPRVVVRSKEDVFEWLKQEFGYDD